MQGAFEVVMVSLCLEIFFHINSTSTSSLRFLRDCMTTLLCHPPSQIELTLTRRAQRFWVVLLTSVSNTQYKLVHHQNIFSAVRECENVTSLLQLFTVPPSYYWLNHYQFTKKSKNEEHALGKPSIENIIINTVVPVWVAYGKLSDEQSYIDRAVQVLQQLPAEENKITRAWKNVGMTPQTSFDSQALIELYNSFCQQKSCLNCAIGASLMRPSS